MDAFLCKIDSSRTKSKFAHAKSTVENLVLCSRFAALQNRLQHDSLLRLHCVNVAMSKVADESVGLTVSVPVSGAAMYSFLVKRYEQFIRFGEISAAQLSLRTTFFVLIEIPVSVNVSR